MTVRTIKDTFSHASCKHAVSRAAMALMMKLELTPNLESNPNALTKEELELLNKVQAMFGKENLKSKQ
jgi:hypothetical protein